MELPPTLAKDAPMEQAAEAEQAKDAPMVERTNWKLDKEGNLEKERQVSKESLSTAQLKSLERIENGLKYFNNQSQHILKLIKAQNTQIEAQSEILKMQSEQLKEMSLLLANIPR